MSLCEPCPVFKPVEVKINGIFQEFELECCGILGHAPLHQSSNGRTWTTAQGNVHE